MKNMHNHIACPNCGDEIDVEAIMASQLETKYRNEFLKEKSLLEQQIQAQQLSLQEEVQTFHLKKQKENELFAEKIAKEKELLKEELAIQVRADFELELESKESDLRKKQAEITLFRKKEIEFEREKNALKEKEQELELAMERKKAAWLHEMEEKTLKRLDERFELKLKEKEKQLEDQRKLIEEMKRKSDQGSMQMQGEVQEIAIEEWLQENFPMDDIDEIKKGARGADCLQIVNTRNKENCGTIYYESKRTKDFQKGWINKFKEDIQAKGADIGVLVTQAMPKDMERMGEKNGIWICTFEEFKGLSFVLRDTIIKINDVSQRDENKGDKMNMLYDFLTSNEFKMQMESIVDGFVQMEIDLSKEKRAMTSIWKQREKQIQKVILNTNMMYSSIKGIAGSAIPSMDVFDLPEDDEPIARILPRHTTELK